MEIVIYADGNINWYTLESEEYYLIKLNIHKL